MADAEHAVGVAAPQAERPNAGTRASGRERLSAAFDRHHADTRARALHSALLDAVNAEQRVAQHLRAAAAALGGSQLGARKLLELTAQRCDVNADNYARFGAVVIDEACRG
jgi:hypothetical protein